MTDPSLSGKGCARLTQVAPMGLTENKLVRYHSTLSYGAVFLRPINLGELSPLMSAQQKAT
jgi:hypothetical protein